MKGQGSSVPFGSSGEPQPVGKFAEFGPGDDLGIARLHLVCNVLRNEGYGFCVLRAPFSTAASIVDQAQGTPQSTGKPVSHCFNVAANG
jgi:hypothetical protein